MGNEASDVLLQLTVLDIKNDDNTYSQKCCISYKKSFARFLKLEELPRDLFFDFIINKLKEGVDNFSSGDENE
jgi:hypothetical protein